MNKTFFENGFLTSTEAQNICNVSKEAISNEHEKLQNVRFYSTKIASIINPEKFMLTSAGFGDIKWINESLDKIGRYNALNAWLKEAIKAKDGMINSIVYADIETYPDYINYEKPVAPTKATNVLEEDIINNWDKDKYNKYLSLNSKAAAIGKYIHDNGSIAVARKDLTNKINNPMVVSGTGRETIVYKYENSIQSQEVENLFMSLLAEHRNLNAQLNKMKAEAKEEANNQNMINSQKYRDEYKEYDKKLSEYYSLVKTQEAKFNEYIISEKERISKLKINVPESLMSTYKEIKSLISE